MIEVGLFTVISGMIGCKRDSVALDLSLNISLLGDCGGELAVTGCG